MNNKGGHLDSAMSTLPLALALVLPMGFFAHVPVINLPLTEALLLLMLIATIHQWQQRRLLRPPFEYWWPTIVLLPLSAVALLRGEGPDSLYLIKTIVVFLAPLALAANGTVACHAITVFSVASGVAALMHLGAERAWLPPTVVFIPTNVLLSGPDTMNSGLLQSCCGLLASIMAIIHPRFAPRERRIAILPLCAILAWLFFLLLHSQPIISAWTAYPFLALAPLSLVVLTIALWIPVRIAARTLLRAAHQKETRLVVLPILIGIGVVLHLGFGARPSIGAIFLLGLAAALDAPWTNHRPFALSFPVWALPGLCVLLQLSGLLPLSSTDPRNQSAHGERLLEASQYHELDGVLRCLLTRQPDHPDYTLLQARSLLAQGWPVAAVKAYRDAARADTPFHLRNKRVFLDSLRDTASAQPRGHTRFLFEQALAHDGEIEQVYNLLEIRRGRVNTTEPAITNPETLKAGLAARLGVTAEALPLEDWDAQALTGILTDAGINVVKLPGNLAQRLGPIILTAHIGPHELSIETAPLQKGQGKDFHRSTSTPMAPQTDFPKLRWGSWKKSGNSAWEIALFARDSAMAILHFDTTATLTIFAESLAGGAESTAIVLCVP